MALPTDRGYVAITDAGGGTHRVDIYAKHAATGPTHLFASHTGVPEVVIETKTAFVTHGKTRISSEPVQVNFSEQENRLYIRDVASFSTTTLV